VATTSAFVFYDKKGTKMKPSVNDLIALHLRYGAGAEPLRVRAFAEMVAKAIYLREGLNCNIMTIRKEIARILNSSTISKKSIDHALVFLESKKLAVKDKGNWKLSQQGIDQIKSDLSRSSARIEKVTKRHFPSDIDDNIIKEWFVEVSVSFFSKFGDIWAWSICRGVPIKSSLPNNLEEVLRPTISKFKLDNMSIPLVRGFRNFITSNVQDDLEQLWSFGQAMFASRLVAANISADPITTEEFKNSRLILDTNILLVASLEKHNLATSMSALAKALKNINMELSFFNITRTEYINLVAYRSSLILKIADRYDEGLLERSNDSFLKTALSRGCKTPEDFDNFFNSIKDPPKSIDNDLTISLIDFSDLDKEIQKGILDSKLVESISHVWLKSRMRPKRKRASEHDAGLLFGAKYLRKSGNKCWVLTLDRTLHEYALKSVGPNEMPLLLSFDALIQILAIEDAGTETEATVFAPLMASILSYQFEPSLETFTLEDLGWLLDVEERCADLTPDDVEKLAIKVNQARLLGKTYDDPELRLIIQRTFQSKKFQAIDDLTKAQKLIETKDSQLNEELEKRLKIENSYLIELKSRMRKTAWQNALIKIFFCLAIFSLVSYITVRIALELSAPGEMLSFLGVIFGGVGLVIGLLYAVFQNIIPNLKNLLKDIESSDLEKLTLKKNDSIQGV
jgi:hypothetical protein